MRGKSAQWLGPVRIDPESPAYLKRLTDLAALGLFLGSLYVVDIVIRRA
jgi:hypothetical protein